MTMNGNVDISSLQDEVEELREELHSVNIKYASKIAVEKDAAEEIEALQRNLEDEKLNQKNLVLKFEEEAKHLNKSWKNEIENLKIEYEDQTKKDADRIEQLEKELKESKDLVIINAESLTKTKDSLEMMSVALAEEIKKKEKAETTIKSLECKLNEMEQRLAETLQMKELKEEEVEPLKERLTQAEEEVALLNSQLRELQGPQKNNESLPDLSTKGNSLFAEVDDRRQLMKQQLLVEKNKIVGLKRAYKAKCSQVCHLQAELTDITRKWKEDATGTIPSQDNLIASLRCRVKELEAAQTVQSSASKNISEREFLGRTNGEVLDHYRWIEMELEQGREEIKRLKESLNERSISKLLSDEALYKMERELRILRAENAHLERIACEQKEKTFDRSEGI